VIAEDLLKIFNNHNIEVGYRHHQLELKHHNQDNKVYDDYLEK
jgi:hypothetical protein